MQKGWQKACVNSMGAVFLVALAALTVTGGGYRAEAAATAPVFALHEQTAPLIVVDAGHGGPDAGTSGIKSGVPEAGLNLQVAKEVERGLLEAGFRVQMTREDEKALASTKQQDMQKRKQIMNGEAVSAVVSIHMNRYDDPAIHGPMAFYQKGAQAGQGLAEVVIKNLCEAVSHPKRPANPGDYFVLRETKAPSVIVECGFLSNPGEEQRLQDPAYQKQLARGIVQGVAAYFAPPLPEPGAVLPQPEENAA